MYGHRDPPGVLGPIPPEGGFEMEPLAASAPPPTPPPPQRSPARSRRSRSSSRVPRAALRVSHSRAPHAVQSYLNYRYMNQNQSNRQRYYISHARNVNLTTNSNANDNAECTCNTIRDTRRAFMPQLKTAAIVGLLHLTQGMLCAWWMRETLQMRSGAFAGAAPVSPALPDDHLSALRAAAPPRALPAADASLFDATPREAPYSAEALSAMTDAALSFMQYCAPLPCIAAVGCFLRLVDRKVGGYLLGIPHFLMAVVHMHASTEIDWRIARTLLNMCMASTAVFSSVFLSEVLVNDARGFYHYVPCLMWYVGFYGAAILLSYTNLFVLCTIAIYVVVIYFVALSCLPETPVFLLRCNKPCEAVRSLQYFRGKEDVEKEFKNLLYTLDELESRTFKGPSPWYEVLNSKAMRYVICVMIGLCIHQQIISYGVPVSLKTLYHLRLPRALAHILVCVAIVTGLIVGATSADSAGRKFCLMCSSLISAIGLFSLAMIKIIPIDPDIVTQFGVIVFLFGYFSALAVLPIVITTEIFSPRILSCMVAVFGITAWSVQFVAALVSKYLHSVFLDREVALFLCLYSICGAILIWVFVPETAKKPVEENVRKIKNRFRDNTERTRGFRVYTLTLIEI